jgi:hypothetical protein
VYCNFANNLSTLRKSVKTDSKYAIEDAESYKHDHTIFPICHVLNGMPGWHGSSAEQFLEQDVDLGRENDFPTRNDFRLSQAEYQVFALDVFRKHVDQAKRRKKQHQENKLKKTQRMKVRDNCLQFGY